MMRKDEKRWKELYVFMEKQGENILPPMRSIVYFRKDYAGLKAGFNAIRIMGTSVISRI
jgi:hypothetical protein